MARWNNRPTTPEEWKSLLLSRVKITSTGCWEYTGAKKGRAGYGGMQYNGKFEGAHRVSYQLYKGSLNGLWVLHRCDNPPCWNPEHLFLGDCSDNLRDAGTKGRHGSQTHPEAHRYGRNNTTKLTVTQVQEIKRRIASGETLRDLAKEFGVGAPQITRIKQGIRWGYVDAV
jgi:hypothetical protein